MLSDNHLLEVQNLKMYFPSPGKGERVLKAVDDVSFRIGQRETLGLVGESGCGKSTLARAIVRLYRPTAGVILFRGEDLAQLEGERLWQTRRQIQMIFQDPYSSLNPRMRVAEILSEPLRNFQLTENLQARMLELVTLVGLDASSLSRYPHEFSGGQRQRIAIARALALNPALVIADEPLSALDVSIQAQIVNLLRELQTRLGLSYLFISHDLSVVSLMSHRVVVMYLGQSVETAPTRELFAKPWHPYTEALLSAIPVPDPRRERSKGRIVLKGDVPSPLHRPPGCPFHPRCPYAFERCRAEKPLLQVYAPGRWVSCHLYAEPERQPRPGSAIGPGSGRPEP
ncbi:MAG: peptide ABC transporter substrate-binding protein [Acidobacteria bacterium RIFCSPLOWO2_02_FULL_59_13]|nr:MAG: peptide ABC transporter substrate-binding protein [Acidobacteria bacterium RIFCSPLOWO2_02_FULL_59_13]